jgi:hypothetical protein
MVLRLLVALATFAASAALCANVMPKAPGGVCSVAQTTLQYERAFPTVLAAVGAMARDHLTPSVRGDREYVGAVLQDAEGRYWAAVGVGCSGQDTVTFSIRVPAGFRIAAFWHTHGAAGPMRDWFSPDDIELVATTGYDFYLITPSGALRVLSRADVTSNTHRALRQFRSAMPRRATVGRAVALPEVADECVASETRPEAAAV